MSPSKILGNKNQLFRYVFWIVTLQIFQHTIEIRLNRLTFAKEIPRSICVTVRTKEKIRIVCIYCTKLN